MRVRTCALVASLLIAEVTFAQLQPTVTVEPESSGTYAAGTDWSGFISDTDDPLGPFSDLSVHFLGWQSGGSPEFLPGTDSHLVYRYKVDYGAPILTLEITVEGAAFQGNDGNLKGPAEIRVLDAGKNVLGIMETNAGNDFHSYKFNVDGMSGQSFFLDEFTTSTTWRYRSKLRAGGCAAPDYDVPGLIITLAPTEELCWASAGTTLLSWRLNRMLTEEQMARKVDRVPPPTELFLKKVKKEKGISGDQAIDFLHRMALGDGLTTPPTVCDVNSRLREFGPMWIVTGFQGHPEVAHARTIIGMRGDGTQDGTFVRIVDPIDGIVHEVRFSNILFAIQNFEQNHPKFPQWVHFDRQ